MGGTGGLVGVGILVGVDVGCLVAVGESRAIPLPVFGEVMTRIPPISTTPTRIDRARIISPRLIRSRSLVIDLPRRKRRNWRIRCPKLRIQAPHPSRNRQAR